MKSILTAVKYRSVPSSQRWGEVCRHFPLLFCLLCSRSVLVQDLVSQLRSSGLCWVVCMPLTFTACSSPLSGQHISVHYFTFSRVAISLREGRLLSIAHVVLNNLSAFGQRAVNAGGRGVRWQSYHLGTRAKSWMALNMSCSSSQSPLKNHMY